MCVQIRTGVGSAHGQRQIRSRSPGSEPITAALTVLTRRVVFTVALKSRVEHQTPRRMKVTLTPAHTGHDGGHSYC